MKKLTYYCGQPSNHGNCTCGHPHPATNQPEFCTGSCKRHIFKPTRSIMHTRECEDASTSS